MFVFDVFLIQKLNESPDDNFETSYTFLSIVDKENITGLAVARKIISITSTTSTYPN